MRLKTVFIFIFTAFLLVSCGDKRSEQVVAPWGEITDTLPDGETFDLDQIQAGGELIVLTLTGPDTYYDYRGQQLGTQYMLARRFAAKLGVGLRVDVCRDSLEMLQRLEAGDGDLIAYPMTGDSPGWLVGPDKDRLREELEAWYTPGLVEEVKHEEQLALSTKSVQRRVFSPMLNRRGGIISHYDQLFMRYSQQIRWDWRLMAAQCYQESTFDPRATSFAGAKGLMQIMPGTADHLGLARDRLYEPESNIAAATKYLGELEQKLLDIKNRNERLKFVLACYNGGFHHISDAQALARRDGKDPYRWSDVSGYVLKLAQPQYYNDPLVKHGYMRGSETVDYVEKIQSRWGTYRGVRTPRTGFSKEPKKAQHENKYAEPQA